MSPVEKHGQLKVDGAKIVDCHGEPVQLRGVSFGWHNMWPRFYNRSSVAEIANDWGADIVRASIGLILFIQNHPPRKMILFYQSIILLPCFYDSSHGIL